MVACPCDSKFSHESVTGFSCVLEDASLCSHQGVIHTSIVFKDTPTVTKDELPLAPKVPNSRTHTSWTTHGISEYQEIITPYLRRLRELWLNQNSPGCLSVPVNSTNSLMITSTDETNAVRVMGEPRKKSSRPVPKEISISKLNLNSAL